jgi:hypothetical protein
VNNSSKKLSDSNLVHEIKVALVGYYDAIHGSKNQNSETLQRVKNLVAENNALREKLENIAALAAIGDAS